MNIENPPVGVIGVHDLLEALNILYLIDKKILEVIINKKRLNSLI